MRLFKLINEYKKVTPIVKTKELKQEDNTNLKNVKNDKLSLYNPDNNIKFNWSEDLGEE